MVTCSYKNYDSDEYETYSISGDRGKLVNYTGKYYPDLASKKEFWQVWHDNIGKVSEEENTRYYVEKYYKQVLSKLDPDKVYKDMEHDILLCYEEPAEFCHRHLVASWLKIILGITVPEVTVKDYDVTEVERMPGLEELLENVIKENTPNMKDFTSLRALKHFEDANKIDDKAYELEDKSGKSYEGLHFVAASIRCHADDIEETYKASQNKRVQHV